MARSKTIDLRMEFWYWDFDVCVVVDAVVYVSSTSLHERSMWQVLELIMMQLPTNTTMLPLRTRTETGRYWRRMDSSMTKMVGGYPELHEERNGPRKTTTKFLSTLEYAILQVSFTQPQPSTSHPPSPLYPNTPKLVHHPTQKPPKSHVPRPN